MSFSDAFGSRSKKRKTESTVPTSSLSFLDSLSKPTLRLTTDRDLLPAVVMKQKRAKSATNSIATTSDDTTLNPVVHDVENGHKEDESRVPVRATAASHDNPPNISSNPDKGVPEKRRSKQKRKRNKKKVKSQKATESTVSASRPGKKKLRKMRYQKKNLSPIEFRLVSAHNLAFTKSVLVLEVEEKSTRDCSHTKVTTTSNLSALLQECKSHAPHQIHVQPLLVLDLNGILCHRVRYYTNARKRVFRHSVTNVANTPVIPRTDLYDFLFFLDRHFCLAVWTSAKQKTAEILVKALFPTEIAARLLFLWTQTQCCVTTSQSINEDDEDNLVFEKDLSKVWKEYPLWNSYNTLLMDDSPAKCVQWHENAIHPPPLHGQKSDWKGNSNTDEENERKQQVFFDGLVGYWKETSLVQQWDKKDSEETLQLQNAHGQLESVHENNGLVGYLRTNAVGHMGYFKS